MKTTRLLLLALLTCNSAFAENLKIILYKDKGVTYGPVPSLNITADDEHVYEFKGAVFEPPISLIGKDKKLSPELVPMHLTVTALSEQNWKAYWNLFTPDSSTALQRMFQRPSALEELVKQFTTLKKFEVVMFVEDNELIYLFCCTENIRPEGYIPAVLKKHDGEWKMHFDTKPAPMWVNNVCLGFQRKTIKIVKQ